MNMLSLLLFDCRTGYLLPPSSVTPDFEDWSDFLLLEYAERVKLFRRQFGTSPRIFLEVERDLEMSCVVSGVRYICPRPSECPAETMARRDRMVLSMKKSESEMRLRARCQSCGVLYEGASEGESVSGRAARRSKMNNSIRRAQSRIRRTKKSVRDVMSGRPVSTATIAQL